MKTLTTSRSIKPATSLHSTTNAPTPSSHFSYFHAPSTVPSPSTQPTPSPQPPPFDASSEFHITILEDANDFDHMMNEFLNENTSYKKTYQPKLSTAFPLLMENATPEKRNLLTHILDLYLTYQLAFRDISSVYKTTKDNFLDDVFNERPSVSHFQTYSLKMQMLGNIQSFIGKNRALWDKIMHLLVEKYGNKEAPAIKNKGSAKDAFEKAVNTIIRSGNNNSSKINELLQFISQHLVKGVIQEFDDIFRTPEIHKSGSARKWVLAEEIKYSPINLLFSFWEFTEFAIELIEKSFQKNPISDADIDQFNIMLPNLFFNLAQNYYNRGVKGDYDKATKSIDIAIQACEALQDSKLTAKLYSLLARVNVKQGKIEEAKISIKKAIVHDDKDAFYHFQKWEIMTFHGKNLEQERKEAKSSLAEAIKIDSAYNLAPKYPEDMYSILELKYYNELLNNSVHDLGIYFNRGVVRLTLDVDDKFIHKAYEDFLFILKEKPTATRVLLLAGICCSKLEKYTKALEYFNQILTLNPNHASALGHKAQDLLALNQLEEALECAIKSIAINPIFCPAYNTAARIYSLQGKHDEAIEQANCLVKIDPSNPNFYYNRGYYYEKRNEQGDLERALDDYKQALSRDPNDYGSEYQLVLALEKQNNSENIEQIFNHLIHILQVNPFHTQAQAKFDKMIQAKPFVNNSICFQQTLAYAIIPVEQRSAFFFYVSLLNTGVELFQIGKYEDAIIFFDEGLEAKQLQNANCSELKNRYIFYKASTLYQLCKKNFLNILQANATTEEEKNTLITKLEECIQLFKSVPEVDKMGVANAFNMLGQLYLLGEPGREKAFACFEEALKYVPNHKDASYFYNELK